MAYELPANYAESPCYVVAINAALIPVIAGSLELLQQRHAWSTDADYERGYNAIAAIKACLMKTCLNELIESNNRLYRLINAGLYGQQYTLVSVDPLVITPSIPEVPDSTILEPGLLFQAGAMRQLVDNSLNGTITPMYVDPDGVKPILRAILQNMLSDVDEAEIIAKLGQVIALLG